MRVYQKLFLGLCVILLASTAWSADPFLEQLQPEQKVGGFTTATVYENTAGEAMGARFVSDKYSFVVDLMRIESVPQAFYWVKTPPTSSKGEAHACEHLLLGKGNRGRYVAVLEDMSLGNSSAFTAQLMTCYHFNTTAGADIFYDLFEAKLYALLHPDFTDEEIRREVCHLGIVENPETGALSIDEKGSVYTEMVSAYEKPWYHTWGSLNRLVYGDNHPLTWNSGGHPDVMRDMTVDDMRRFHDKCYHLGGMGAVVSIPSSIGVEDCLGRLEGILQRCQEKPDQTELIGIGALDLPEPKPEPHGTIKMVTYPSDSEEDQGYMLYAWPADLELSLQDQLMLNLFLSSFAGGATTNLYDLFLNQETRQLDIGGSYLYSGFDSDQGYSIYWGLVGVDRDAVTEAMVDSVAALVRGELARVSQYADGSDELKEFNAKVRSHIEQSRKQYDDYLNSPPMFGFRSGVGSGWVRLLRELEQEDSFRKALKPEARLSAADSLLSLDRNIWQDYIESWRLLSIPPYSVGAIPDPGMLTLSAEAKNQRINGYVDDFKTQYGTEDPQVALAHFRDDFDARTAELEAIAAGQTLPEFIDEPPMTLDDQLVYEEITLASDVPMVASTFDNMASSTLGLALRLDVIPESLLVYVPFLPDALTEIGVVKDGEVVSYEDMALRLRSDVMGLGAGFEHGFNTGRTELVLAGEASKLEELHNAIAWMDAALFSPLLTVDNLPRIQDVIDQSLQIMRTRMKGSEEWWVQYPARGYRFQDNPLVMSTDCFLTQTHHLQRLRWRLTDPGDEKSALETQALFEVLGEIGRNEDRSHLLSILSNLELIGEEELDSAILAKLPPARTLTETSRKNVARIAKELKASLNDIPDENLSSDWEYLCRETAADLLVQPAAALAEIEAVLDLVRHADNARAYLISNSRDRAATQEEISTLVGRLDADGEVVRQNYAPTQRVVERLRSREGDIDDPVYVGLVNEGTRNGVLVFSAQFCEPYDTTDAAITDCLAGKLYGGGGPHGIFMKTWGAGLAYSNGYGFRHGSGRVSYYAERCPDVAETMGFVVSLLEDAEEDPSLAGYAVAQVFGYSRAPNRYEDRGEAMASDLADGITPDRVRSFRQAVLEQQQDPDLYTRLQERMEAAYGPVLIGYGPSLAESRDGTFFLIGPEPQFQSLERYVELNEEPQPVYRLYPRDFWLTM